MSCKTFIWFIAVAVIGVALLYQAYFTKQLSHVISVPSGDLQGLILRSRAGREFVACHGIPFAKPPIGEKRFQSPEKFETWDGVWDATYYRPICQQFDFFVSGWPSGSEDCLYLNVFTPKGIKGTNGMPVMVDIHGGYFHMGGASTQGAHFFMDHDVVVVTISYRLGVLGFLTTGDGTVRGNMGLKDQNLALQWVQQNINFFGGDRERVTLLGESAGSSSVHYHMLSPRSKNLFSRAIRQSGSALNYWSMMGNSHDRVQQAKDFAKRVNCPWDNTQNMVNCLRNLDADALVSGHADLMVHPISQESKFVPSIENIFDEDAFLTENPMDTVKNGKFNVVPLLSGFNMDEGLFHTAVLYVNATKLDDAIDNWFDFAPKAFHYGTEMRNVSQKIYDFYFGPYVQSYKTRSDWIQNFTNVYGDRLFNYGIHLSATHERKYTPEMYNYLYDHHGGFSLSTLAKLSQTSHPVLSYFWEVARALIWNKLLGLDVPLAIPGACHADELALLWHSFHFEAFYSEQKDQELSQKLVKLWVDFASDVKPLKFDGVQLPLAAGSEPLKYIRLSDEKAKVIEHPFKERMDFWRDLKI